MKRYICSECKLVKRTRRNHVKRCRKCSGISNPNRSVSSVKRKY